MTLWRCTRVRAPGDPRGGVGQPYQRYTLGFTLPPKRHPVAIMVVMSWRVLVVDDDPAFRGLAGRMLGACGLALAGEAGSVAAAIAAACALRPSAFLVDIGLPDGDGITLAGRLTALPWRPLVVLTSSDSEAATPADVERCGATAFVPKDQLPNAPLHSLLGSRGA